jgi:hypothetical protein
MAISKTGDKTSIKKAGGIAPAFVTCGGFGSVVLADCDADRESAAYEAEALARYVRCVDYPPGLLGSWPADNPIWQFRPRRGGFGCEVNYKLSKKLDEAPPEKTGNKGKPNNTNRGVASALRDYKDQAAYELVQQFMDTIAYSGITGQSIRRKLDSRSGVKRTVVGAQRRGCPVRIPNSGCHW